MEGQDLTVQPVPNAGWDDRIRVFQLGRLVTSFAVVSRRYVVLLDTMVNRSTGAALLEGVRDVLSERELLVINTHADWDHCWGNQVFAGPDALEPATILAHRLCRERMESEATRRELEHMQQQSPITFGGLRIQPPTEVFEGRHRVDCGDLTIELIPTPGHQPDHVSVLVPELGTLFAGDAAELPLPYVADWRTLGELRRSLAVLAGLDTPVALYCHAEGCTSLDVVRDNIAYFDELERHARSALAAGSVPEELDEGLDVEVLLGYPLERVAGYETLDAEQQEAYRSTHQIACAAMVRFLRHH